MLDWSVIRHFKREEFVHDPDRISPDVVLLMDDMRDAAPQYLGEDVTFRIHVGFDTSGHVADSGHYAGGRDLACAVDFHMERGGTPVPLIDQWLYAERWPWLGVGLYRFWKFPGLHVDLRRLGREHPGLGRRWYRDEANAYKAIDRGFVAQLLRDAGNPP